MKKQGPKKKKSSRSLWNRKTDKLTTSIPPSTDEERDAVTMHCHPLPASQDRFKGHNHYTGPIPRCKDFFRQISANDKKGSRKRQISAFRASTEATKSGAYGTASPVSGSSVTACSLTGPALRRTLRRALRPIPCRHEPAGDSDLKNDYDYVGGLFVRRASPQPQGQGRWAEAHKAGLRRSTGKDLYRSTAPCVSDCQVEWAEYEGGICDLDALESVSD